jgi:hypothetical protein
MKYLMDLIVSFRGTKKSSFSTPWTPRTGAMADERDIFFSQQKLGKNGKIIPKFQRHKKVANKKKHKMR